MCILDTVLCILHVFSLIDCFARGDLTYSAGPGCASAVQAISEAGLSLALFAPGWSLECGEANACKDSDVDAARRCDARFWEALGVARLFAKWRRSGRS